MEEGAEGREEGQAGQGHGLTTAGRRDASAPEQDEAVGSDAPGDANHSDAHPADPAPDANPADPANADPGAVWRAAVPYLVVTAAALFLTRSFWLPWSYVVGFDTYAYSGPHLEVTERAVADGRLPLINDMIFGGVPQLGNPQAGVWYPAHLLLQVLETNRAMNLAVAAHVVLLGIGMVVLAHRLGVGRIGATAAGLASVGSGGVLVKTTQFEQILSLAWAPLLLAAIHATLTSPGRPWRAVAATALTTAAALTAGHPQLAYQTAFLALGAAIGFAVGGERWRRLPHLAGGVALGLLLAAPALVASLSASTDSALDAGRTFERLRSTALSVETDNLLRALVGTPQAIEPATFAGGPESIGFVGVAVALLGVVGAARMVARRDARAWAIGLLAVAVLGTFWSLGPRTAVFRVAFDLVPGFDLARGSGRWLVTVGLVVALFAGIAVQAIAERAVHRRDIVTGAIAVAVVAITVATGVVDAFSGRTAMIWTATAVLVIGLIAVAVGLPRPRAGHVAAVAAVALVALELGAMSRTSFPQQLRADEPFTAHRSTATDWLLGRDGTTMAFTDDGREPAYLVPGLRPNTNALLSIPSIDGYDGGVQVTERWTTALYRFQEEPFLDLPMRNSLPVPAGQDALARLGVRFMLLDSARGGALFLDGWDGPQALDRDFWVYENPAWIGEAIAWRATEAVGSDRAAADLLRTEPDRLGDVGLVDDPDAALTCDEPAGCAPVGLAVDERTPEHLLVRTALDEPSVVMLTRQALPGWEVRVDGRRASEVVVDGLFLGVEVPAGEHEIDWRYRSPFLAPSLVMALIALLAVGALLVPWHTVGGDGFRSVSRWRREGR